MVVVVDVVVAVVAVAVAVVVVLVVVVVVVVVVAVVVAVATVVSVAIIMRLLIAVHAQCQFLSVRLQHRQKPVGCLKTYFPLPGLNLSWSDLLQTETRDRSGQYGHTSSGSKALITCS